MDSTSTCKVKSRKSDSLTLVGTREVLGNSLDKNETVGSDKNHEKMFNISNRTVVYEEDTKKNTSNLSAGDIVLMVVEKGTNARVIERVIDNEHKLEDIIAGKKVDEDDDDDKKTTFDLNTDGDKITVGKFVYNEKDGSKNAYVLRLTGENGDIVYAPQIDVTEDNQTIDVTVKGLITQRYTVELYRRKISKKEKLTTKKWDNKFISVSTW